MKDWNQSYICEVNRTLEPAEDWIETGQTAGVALLFKVQNRWTTADIYIYRLTA